MIRVVIKLAIAVLIANAGWRIGSAYVSFYSFEDAVQEASRFAGDKSEADLRQRILELAAQFDLPVTESSFSIRREHDHTYIDGTYTQPLEVLPRYRYPWSFTWSTDTFTIPGAAASRPRSP